MSVHACCLKGFQWDGKPTGTEAKVGQTDTYVTGENPDKAVILIHDLFGWTFANIRLLSDHLATEIGATVYAPDFFGGEVLPAEPIIKGEFEKLDIGNFLKRNSREVREPEIFEFARQLRPKYKKLAAVGYCYGGWAVFRLGAAEHQPPLVDCIVAGHPSMLTKEDIDGVAVPVQMLAPEIDPPYTPELKSYTFETLQKLGVPFDYQHFPKVEHSCFIRGDPGHEGERDAMIRGKNAAVSFVAHYFNNP